MTALLIVCWTLTTTLTFLTIVFRAATHWRQSQASLWRTDWDKATRNTQQPPWYVRLADGINDRLR